MSQGETYTQQTMLPDGFISLPQVPFGLPLPQQNIFIECAACYDSLPEDFLQNPFVCDCSTEYEQVLCEDCKSSRTCIVNKDIYDLFVCTECKREINIPRCPCNEGFVTAANDKDGKVIFSCGYCHEQD